MTLLCHNTALNVSLIIVSGVTCTTSYMIPWCCVPELNGYLPHTYIMMCICNDEIYKYYTSCISLEVLSIVLCCLETEVDVFV